MRIRIEPTNDPGPGMVKNHSVEVVHPSDSLTIAGVLSLVSAALIAWGYSAETVREYVEEWEPE